MQIRRDDHVLKKCDNCPRSPLRCQLYISRLTPKCRMICRLTPKSCVMYAGLRLAKTFVCCCPDLLNKRMTDSKIESVRRKLCSVRAKSTFVVASSQSQRVVCARQRLLLRSGRDISTTGVDRWGTGEVPPTFQLGGDHIGNVPPPTFLLKKWKISCMLSSSNLHSLSACVIDTGVYK